MGMSGAHWRAIRADVDPDAPPEIKRASVGRVWRFAKQHRLKILGYLTTIFVTSALMKAPPILLGKFVDSLGVVTVSWNQTGAPPGNVDELRSTVMWIVAGFLVLPIARALIQILSRWLSASVGEGVIFDLRVALFDKVQKMPIAFFTRTRTGALVSRLNNDVVGAQSALTQTLGTVATNISDLVLTLLIMLAIDVPLTLLVFATAPLFVLPSRNVAKRIAKLFRTRFDHQADMTSMMQERFNVSGALLSKLFGRPDTELKKFADPAGRVRDTGIQQALTFVVFSLIVGTLAAIATAVVYMLGANRIFDGKMAAGELVTFGALVQVLLSTIEGLAGVRVDIASAIVSFDRVFEVLDLPELITEKPEAVELPNPEGRITVENMSFRYPTHDEVPIGSLDPNPSTPQADPNKLALSNVNFEINPGETIALVGSSGAGKSTLASLVMRLYDPVEGSVKLDGHDLRDLKLQSIYGAIGAVAQDPHLFHESVKDNLLYAKPDATDEQIHDACRAARIHDLIASLPDGYDTVVGERGYRFSGGEKQRVAIARMILKDPKVVILDEATSHLDSTSEAAIQQALAELLKDRSSLVIAHRLSTIRAADRILVLENGEIVEQGRHDELVALNGRYAELYRTQFERSTV